MKNLNKTVKTVVLSGLLGLSLASCSKYDQRDEIALHQTEIVGLNAKLDALATSVQLEVTNLNAVIEAAQEANNTALAIGLENVTIELAQAVTLLASADESNALEAAQAVANAEASLLDVIGENFDATNAALAELRIVDGDIQNDIEILFGRLTSVEVNINDSNTDLTDLISQLTATVAAANELIQANIVSIDALNDRVDALNIQLGGIITNGFEITNIQAQLNALSSYDDSEVLTRLTALEDDIASLETDILNSNTAIGQALGFANFVLSDFSDASINALTFSTESTTIFNGRTIPAASNITTLGAVLDSTLDRDGRGTRIINPTDGLVIRYNVSFESFTDLDNPEANSSNGMLIEVEYTSTSVISRITTRGTGTLATRANGQWSQGAGPMISFLNFALTEAQNRL